MALGATIYRLELAVADMDRHYYANHSFTLAQTSIRERRAAYVAGAGVYLACVLRRWSSGVVSRLTMSLTSGKKDLTGGIERWIDLGMPDEKRIRKACGRATNVELLTYGGSKASVWYDRMGRDLERFKNLRICSVDPAASAELASIASRSMELNASLQEGQVLISSGAASVQVEPVVVKILTTGSAKPTNPVDEQSHRRVLLLAFPIILSNLSVSARGG